MAIKTITQYLDCLEIKGIFPDDYQASLEVPYSNGSLAMRFLVTKMIDENADLAGYLFTPQIFQGKNTSAVGSDVTIVCNSATSTQWTIGGLSTNSTVITPEISSGMGINLEPDTWVDLHPSLAFGKEIPQRGKVYNFRGNIDIGYSVTATINDNPVTLNYTINFDFSSTLTSEALETHIYNPLYAQPYNSSVDATETELDFSMQFSGEQLNTYETEIFNSETNNRVYPPETMLSNPITTEETLYNQDQLSFKVPEGIYDTHNLINNNKYKWHNILSRYSNDNNAGNLVDNNKFLFYKENNPLENYTQLECVTRPNITPPMNTNVNWLYLGYTPKATTKIRIKFSNAQTGFYIVGGGIGDILTTTNWGLYRLNSDFYFAQRNTFQTLIEGSAALIKAPQLYQDNKIYDLTIGNNFIWDNIEQKYIASWKRSWRGYFDSYPDFVNLCRAGGSYYSIQIWEDGDYGMPLSNTDILKYNFIPAKNNLNNHIGMYETVNSVFYQNDKSESYNPNLLQPGRELGVLDYSKLQVGNFAKISPLTLGLNSGQIGTDNNILSGVDINLNNVATNANNTGYNLKYKFYLFPKEGISTNNTLNLFYLPCQLTGTGTETSLSFKACLNGSVVDFVVTGVNGNSELLGSINLPTPEDYLQLISPLSSSFQIQETYFESNLTISFNSSANQLNCYIDLKYYFPGETAIISETATIIGTDIASIGQPNILSISSPRSHQSGWYRNFFTIQNFYMGTNYNNLNFWNDTINNSLVLYDETSFVKYNLIPEVFYSAIPSSCEKTTAYQQYPKFETPDYGFYAYNIPTIVCYLNETLVEDYQAEHIIDSPHLIFTAKYNQLQNIAIKYYNIVLYDKENNIITQTENIYSNDIVFDFLGLAQNEIYSLKLNICSQAEQYQTIIIENIKADYIGSSPVIPTLTRATISVYPMKEWGANLVSFVPLRSSSSLGYYLRRRKWNQPFYEKFIFLGNITNNDPNYKIQFYIDLDISNNEKYIYEVFIHLQDQQYYAPTSLSCRFEGEGYYVLPVSITQQHYEININNPNFNQFWLSMATLDIQNKRIQFPVTIGEITPKSVNISKGDYIFLQRVDGGFTRGIYQIINSKIESIQEEDYYIVDIIPVSVYRTTGVGTETEKIEDITSSLELQIYGSDGEIALINNADFDKIWKFYLNCKESNITLNQDKTIFNSFSKYPKYSIGLNNYYSGSFSALLGYNTVSDYYYDTLELIERWKTFVESNQLCLYKNMKGDVILSLIESGSSREYMNEVANYRYIGEEISDYPTTINFNYTQVDNVNKLNGGIQPNITIIR